MERYPNCRSAEHTGTWGTDRSMSGNEFMTELRALSSRGDLLPCCPKAGGKVIWPNNARQTAEECIWCVSQRPRSPVACFGCHLIAAWSNVPVLRVGEGRIEMVGARNVVLSFSHEGCRTCLLVVAPRQEGPGQGRGSLASRGSACLLRISSKAGSIVSANPKMEVSP